jgi:hypothetical protein
MNISTFDDLLSAARSQPLPQRLLFVFAGVELPEDATPAQRLEFERGEGGALVPQMCVDKGLDELHSFDQLSAGGECFRPALGHGVRRRDSSGTPRPPARKRRGRTTAAGHGGGDPPGPACTQLHSVQPARRGCGTGLTWPCSIPLSVQITLPGHARSPRPGFGEAPFEMLGACHERVERMLVLLARLRAPRAGARAGTRVWRVPRAT